MKEHFRRLERVAPEGWNIVASDFGGDSVRMYPYGTGPIFFWEGQPNYEFLGYFTTWLAERTFVRFSKGTEGEVSIELPGQGICVFVGKTPAESTLAALVGILELEAKENG